MTVLFAALGLACGLVAIEGPDGLPAVYALDHRVSDYPTMRGWCAVYAVVLLLVAAGMLAWRAQGRRSR